MATDDEIRAQGIKFLPKQEYLQNPYELPTDTEEGIVNTNSFVNNNDGGSDPIYIGPAGNLITDFDAATSARQNRFNNPSDTFLGFNTMRDQQLTGADAGFYDTIPQEQTMMGKAQSFLTPQSADQIISQGYKPQVKLGILANLLPDNYGTLPRADQAFIAQNMGYSGPTVFGENKGNQDPFGINTRSAFGNYGEYVSEKATSLEEALEDAKNKDKYNKGGKFNKALFDKNTKLLRTKLDFYRNKKQEREQIQSSVLEGQMERDRDAGAKGISDPQDQSRTGSSGRRPGSGGNVTATAANTNKETGTTYDSGGREGFGYGLKEGGRAGYFFGGRAKLKSGGRINFKGGGMDMGNEENQKQSAAMGNTTVSSNNDGSNDNPANFFVEDKTSIVDNSGLLSKSPEINVDYTDPRNYASLKSRIYNTNILDNDNINVDGTLSGEIGPVNYGVDFTDQGITNTNLTAGNFSAGIDANKNYNVGYANNYNGIDYGTTYDSDGNLMFNAGVKFKNGGRARYAEGGPIYSRLGTLNSGVQSAEQQLQSINASLQKAESDLGGESSGGGSSLSGGPSFTSNFQDANNQGPGSNLLFGGSMDQDSPSTAPTTNTFVPEESPTTNSFGGPLQQLQTANPISSIGGQDPVSSIGSQDPAREAYDKLQASVREQRRINPYTRDVKYGENMTFEDFKKSYDAGTDPNQPTYSGPPLQNQLQSSGGGLGGLFKGNSAPSTNLPGSGAPGTGNLMSGYQDFANKTYGDRANTFMSTGDSREYTLPDGTTGSGSSTSIGRINDYLKSIGQPEVTYNNSGNFGPLQSVSQGLGSIL